MTRLLSLYRPAFGTLALLGTTLALFLVMMGALPALAAWWEGL